MSVSSRWSAGVLVAISAEAASTIAERSIALGQREVNSDASAADVCAGLGEHRAHIACALEVDEAKALALAALVLDHAEALDGAVALEHVVEVAVRKVEGQVAHDHTAALRVLAAVRAGAALVALFHWLLDDDVSGHHLRTVELERALQRLLVLKPDEVSVAGLTVVAHQQLQLQDLTAALEVRAHVVLVHVERDIAEVHLERGLVITSRVLSVVV